MVALLGWKGGPACLGRLSVSLCSRASVWVPVARNWHILHGRTPRLERRTSLPWTPVSFPLFPGIRLGAGSSKLAYLAWSHSSVGKEDQLTLDACQFPFVPGHPFGCR